MNCMIPKKLKQLTRTAFPGLPLFLLAGLSGQAQTQDTDGIAELEAFIAEETGVVEGTSMSPLARPSSAAFGGDRSVLETPRAVTVLTPEVMKQMDVRSFEDLEKVSAGTSRPNIFGLPGSPHIRGDLGGVYFNGMLRIFNRNERPTGFGSLESMDLVKGPAPANLSATDVGGYAYFIPKSPFFDEQRGKLRVTVGSYDHYNTQLDIGGPILVGGDTPAAYRISVTGQISDSYWNDVSNDYVSLYASLKAKLSENVRIYTGTEFFRFNTNENAGWNRLTQDLIDRGEYIIGETAPDTASAAFNGNANLFKTYNFFPHQNAAATGTYIPDIALVVPADIFEERFPQNPENTGAEPVFDPADGSLFGYRYTPEYFDNGNDVLTTTIEGDEVLSDPGDFAESNNFLWFLDVEQTLNEATTVNYKTFFEWVEAEKLSSYGFANFNDTWKIEQKIVVNQDIDLGDMPTTLSYGLDLNYTESEWHIDFFAEPFNRRDISTGAIVPQSIVPAGPQNDFNNDGEWDLDAGDTSEYWQAAVFAQATVNVTEQFDVIAGLRGEYADWTGTNINNFLAPDGAGGFSFSVGSTPFEGTETYWTGNINPIFTINDQFSIYGAAQFGAIFNPNQVGGLDQGENHFNEASLWEAGAKASFMDGNLFVSLAAYEWTKTITSSTVAGDAQDAFRGQGVELEATATPVDGLTILFNTGAQRVYARTNIPFGTRPLTPEQTALFSGSIQYDVVTDPAVRYANNPDQVKPGYPEVTASLYAVYEFDNGFGIGGGPVWRDQFWADYERTLTFPSALVWNANLFWRNDTWEILFRVSNLTDEDYFMGNDGSFADNTIATVAKPIEGFLTVTRSF
ncbi:MAG: TonB-dependent siderophore receptor [Opitutales bacterium]